MKSWCKSSGSVIGGNQKSNLTVFFPSKKTRFPKHNSKHQTADQTHLNSREYSKRLFRNDMVSGSSSFEWPMAVPLTWNIMLILFIWTEKLRAFEELVMMESFRVRVVSELVLRRSTIVRRLSHFESDRGLPGRKRINPASGWWLTNKVVNVPRRTRRNRDEKQRNPRDWGGFWFCVVVERR